jgi:hypothetical protein
VSRRLGIRGQVVSFHVAAPTIRGQVAGLQVAAPGVRFGAGRSNFVGYSSAAKLQILVGARLEEVDMEGHGPIWWEEGDRGRRRWRRLWRRTG